MPKPRLQLEDFGSFFGISHFEVAGKHPSSRRDRSLPTGRVNESVQARAYVNHGRWVARCPLCVGGCELADLEDGLFFCCECRNAEVGFDYLRTGTPAVGERKKIEALLLRREDDRNRNWRPHETVQDLERENASHGVN